MDKNIDKQMSFSNRQDFREWLTQNHDKSQGIWIAFSKSDKASSIKAGEALEEAICFGWIDGQIKSLDDIKYVKKFTPRRKGSKWSEKNKGLANKLIKEEKMLQSGLAAIEQAKIDGTWDAPKAEPISNEKVSILTEALKGVEPAFSNFENMSRSVKAIYTAHYLSAKAEETRKRRLEQIIGRLNENKKPM